MFPMLKQALLIIRMAAALNGAPDVADDYAMVEHTDLSGSVARVTHSATMDVGIEFFEDGSFILRGCIPGALCDETGSAADSADVHMAISRR